MVLASEILASTASDENSYHPNRNFLHPYSSSNSQEATPLKPDSNNKKINNNQQQQPQQRKSTNSQLLNEKPNWNSRGRACRNKMQNSSSKPNSEEAAGGRGLKMRIKKKPGANKSDEKHEIVKNSCESDKSKTNKIKRGRVRIKSGNSSSECDPYEFSTKNEDEELPPKRIKLDPINESPATREVGINAVTLGTMTEPDLLGPCEPGSRICLNGIVWLETDTGLLVINVTWRGRTYVGTLLDSTKHDFAPPCPRDYVSPIESRNYTRGRGKRRGGNFQQSYRSCRGSTKGRGLGRTAPLSESTTPTDSDDDSKRNRLRGLSPSNSTADCEQAGESNYPIECLQQNCSKRFADITALGFHMNQTHIRKQLRNPLSSSDNVKNQTPSRPRSLEVPLHYKSGVDITDSSPIENANDSLLNTLTCEETKLDSQDSVSDDRLFKTPGALSLNSTNNLAHSNKAISPVSPLNGTTIQSVVLSNNSIPSDNNSLTFSFPNNVASNLSINHSSKSLGHSPPQMNRVVTAHTVNIPLDKSPAQSNSPTTTTNKKKSDDQQKKLQKRSSYSSNPSANKLTTAAVALPPNCLTADVHSANILDNSLAAKSPSTALKPIQPKPKSLHLLPTNNTERSNQSDKKLKSKKSKSKEHYEKMNAESVTSNNSIDLRMNGMSFHNHNDKSEAYDNPASPAYSDISNDSPAPVLEKEVDVKSQVDRSGQESEIVIGQRNNIDPSNYLFSQPPSLVPAVVSSEKNSVQSVCVNDALETTSKSSLEEKSSSPCLSTADKRAALDFSKKEPPALTKLPDSNKSVTNSSGTSSLSASYNKQARENPPSMKHCGIEVSTQPGRTSHLSDNKVTSQPYSVNNLTTPCSIESQSIPITSSAFNSMSASDFSNLSRYPHYMHQFNPVNSINTLSNGMTYSHNIVQSALNSHINKPPSSQHKIHELVEKTAAATTTGSLLTASNATASSHDSSAMRLHSPLTALSNSERGRKSPGEMPLSSHNMRPVHPLLQLIPPLFAQPGHAMHHHSSPSFPDSYGSSFLLPPNGTSAPNPHSLLFNHHK